MLGGKSAPPASAASGSRGECLSRPRAVAAASDNSHANAARSLANRCDVGLRRGYLNCALHAARCCPFYFYLLRRPPSPPVPTSSLPPTTVPTDYFPNVPHRTPPYPTVSNCSSYPTPQRACDRDAYPPPSLFIPLTNSPAPALTLSRRRAFCVCCFLEVSHLAPLNVYNLGPLSTLDNASHPSPP